jgi:anaerobic magnesium-protoporphyrin IX monomethyl ester cyclase
MHLAVIVNTSLKQTLIRSLSVSFLENFFLRVALVRGCLCGKDAYGAFFGVSMPPLGLASLAGALRYNGHRVFLMDALSRGSSVDTVAEAIIASRAQVVGVTMNASPYYEFGVQLAKKVKAEGDDVVFVAGGHHATFLYQEVLRNGFNYSVIGEGEQTLVELVDALEVEKNPYEVKGLAFLEHGKPFVTETRSPQQNLDLLPMPAFDLFEKELCAAPIFGENSYFVTLETSRGCPYNCEFCSVTAMWGHCWRFKSVERILEELKYVKKLGYNWVFVVDDNFMVPANINERKLLFKEMQDRRLDSLNFIAQIRADIAAKRPEMISKAAQAGLRIAFIGVESGSDEVLKAMGKGTCAATTAKGVKVLHKNGILIHGGFIVGAPYENRKQMDCTVKYADQLRALGLDSVQFSIYTPLPGTKAFSEALSKGKLLTHDWSLYDCLHPVLKTGLSPLWLYVKLSLSEVSFFLKKWFSDVTATKHETLSRSYRELVKNASNFILKNLMGYEKVLLMTPVDAARFWSKLKKPKKMSPEIINEMLNGEVHVTAPNRKAEARFIPSELPSIFQGK